MGCKNDLKWARNGDIIINNANMDWDNLLPKRVRLSASENTMLKYLHS